MNKRFFDRDIWKKQWFRKLSPAEKSAWFYLTSTCDAVGVYENDTELAEIFIGETVDWEGLKKKVNENIKTIGENKWWLADFCNFQYGELKETSNSLPIKSYIKTLKRHGLWEAYQKGLVKGTDTLAKGYKKTRHSLKEKEKEKDKEKDKDKDKDKEIVLRESKSLFAKIKESFELVGGRFTNYAKEGKAINKIIEYTKGDEQEIQLMLETFNDLRNSTKDFWASMPFTPSRLASSGVWDSVKVEAGKRQKAIEPWWDSMEKQA